MNRDTPPLRTLPSVDSLINTTSGAGLIDRYGRDSVVKIIRKVLDSMRRDILDKDNPDLPDKSQMLDWIQQGIEGELERIHTPSLQKAINATGVILHTGLGRAVLPEGASESIKDVIEGYCTLAADIKTGKRGHRDIHLNDLICEITGAEAAVVVNNNAAATMLILNTLAEDREVILSRGQLVEIGGSFRMPDVMKTSGAILKEVGTTNKTHLRDYSNAIGENTGAIMRVHHSNYRIMGFFSEPGVNELTELAQQHGLHMIDDIGSGALVDLKEFGIESEPLVQDSIKAGVDVACFSGDKLIGGPQAGVIIGKQDIIKRIGKNPLMRAFRVGKMTIAGMEAAFRLFLRPDKLSQEHPVYRMFAAKVDQLNRRARRMLRVLKNIIPEEGQYDVLAGASQVGSGSVPVETIPSKLLGIKPKTLSAEKLAACLRHHTPPIFSRVHKEAVLLDFRTIHPKEDRTVLDALQSILKDQNK